MKAYKVELLVVDHDDMGAEGIEIELGNTEFANHCMHPRVMKVVEKDIGEWDDDHPLNSYDTMEKEYKKLFG